MKERLIRNNPKLFDDRVYTIILQIVNKIL